jgi:dolichol kinase
VLTPKGALAQLAVGVLDSLAAIGGVAYGRHRWPGTSKTAEGTAIAVCGTCAATYLVSHAVGCQDNESFVQVCVPVVVVGLLEAATVQIDNLVLAVGYATCMLLVGVPVVCNNV